MASAATLSLLLLVLAVGEYNCDLLDDLHLRCSTSVVNGFQAYMRTMPTDVDEICRRYEEVKPCAELIYGDDPSKEYVLGAMDYMCAASRRELVRQASASTCMASPMAIQVSAMQISRQSETCYTSQTVRAGIMRIGAIIEGNGAGATSDICPIINIVSDCITNYIGAICGEEMQEVAQGLLATLLDIALSPYLSSCFEQVSQVSQMHNVAKRAVDSWYGQV